MVKFSEFKKTILLFKRNNIRYWVFGGFAIDGLRGKITRPHGDIDVYLQYQDIKKIFKMYDKDYVCFRRGNMYFVERGEFKIGIVPLRENIKTVSIRGNKTIARYPKEIFLKNNIGKIKDFSFRIIPNEALFFESVFSRFKKDKKAGNEIKHNKELFNQIKTIKIKD